jgi:hypothetical protein
MDACHVAMKAFNGLDLILQNQQPQHTLPSSFSVKSFNNHKSNSATKCKIANSNSKIGNRILGIKIETL